MPTHGSSFDKESSQKTNWGSTEQYILWYVYCSF